MKGAKKKKNHTGKIPIRLIKLGKVIILQIQISKSILLYRGGAQASQVSESLKSHGKVTSPRKIHPSASQLHKLRDSPKSSLPLLPRFFPFQITRCKHEIRDATPIHRDQPSSLLFPSHFFIIRKEEPRKIEHATTNPPPSIIRGFVIFGDKFRRRTCRRFHRTLVRGF